MRRLTAEHIATQQGGAPPPWRCHGQPTPRNRLRGGDLPRGGRPPATGHAGRQGLIRAFVLFQALVIVAGFAASFAPSSALADTDIRFANGGTATMASDGTITGTCKIATSWHGLAVTFPTTMPDGQKIEGHCIDYGLPVPAAGAYTFTATPNKNGTYNVLVHSENAAYYEANGSSGPLKQDPGDSCQRVGEIVWSPKLMGRLKVSKTSAIPNITQDNRCYSLAGAQYRLYEDEACTKPMGDSYNLTTASDGTSNEVEIRPGIYWVKEAVAPRGYRLDATAHKVTVGAGEQISLTVADTPLFEGPDLWANKRDAQCITAQGGATLAGAEFTVRYYDGIYGADSLPAAATRTWVIRSNDAGRLVPSNASLVRGGAFFRSGNTIVLPLGTIAIQETKAPTGYWLEGQTSASPADYVAPVHVTTVNGSGSFQSIVVQEQVRRAGVAIRKEDVQTGAQAQGDASFADISFNLINRNKQTVVVDGESYAPGAIIGKPLVTNADGYASTPADYLPVGTYELAEATTNASMLLDATPQTITLTSAHTNNVIPLPAPFKDRVVRGGVKVGKISRETESRHSQGEAALKGATLSVTLDSEQPVLVNGTLYRQGEVVCRLTTQEDGTDATEARALPYGTYTIREEVPPEGFLLNADWSRTFSIRTEGEVIDLSDEEESVDDQVMRGGFHFNKVDDVTMERLGGVAWLVTSNTTGESHVLVGDENGIVDTEVAPHDANTNANDQAFSNGTVDDKALDPNAGIWFSGRTNLQTTPNNELAALPYDTYTVQELACDANKDRALVTFTVRVHKHDVHIDMGSVDNKPLDAKIGTSFTYGETHVAPAQEKITLIDTVSYEGLEPKQEYELRGSLWIKEKGAAMTDEDGNALVVTKRFTPKQSSGSEAIAFDIDTSKLEGLSLVAFEELYKNNQPATRHTEIDDEGQTIHIPRIGTSLASEEGSKEVLALEHTTLVDTVAYSNLIPGLRYEVVGTLIDKGTGMALVDETGQEAQATTSFVPTDTEGETKVVFTIPGSVGAGKELVAFETLRHAGLDIAFHRNLDDAEQTIRIPSIHTQLTGDGGSHIVSAADTVEMVDAVSFEQLEVGALYTLHCMLVDQETGDAIVDASGQETCATASFTPEECNGITSIGLSVEGSAVAGKVVVAFEELSRDDHVVAVHKDLKDTSQTVYVPHIGTTLTSTDGTHEAGGAHTTLVDTVSYDGLQPGTTYTLVGMLVDKQSGKPLEGSDGSALTAETKLVPQEVRGVAEVCFELDASSYAGSSLVAFEFLHEGEGDQGRILAEHADVNSEEQSVNLPRLRTTATNADHKGEALSPEGEIHIQDTVEYEGLTPGTTYVMQGTLRDKANGTAITADDGAKIVAATSFTPTKASGSVVVDFSLDARLITGDGVVVFESCQREGHEVASHADLKDQNQTVLLGQRAAGTASGPFGRPTPSTGDTTSYLLAIGLAVLGSALLVARRLLR